MLSAAPPVFVSVTVCAALLVAAVCADYRFPQGTERRCLCAAPIVANCKSFLSTNNTKLPHLTYFLGLVPRHTFRQRHLHEGNRLGK